ncbi:MAG: hypothetical protein MB54_06495 [marine actinobacterium MedAcidi-G2B]|nr:MAG: hypothetical protein MB54_06495 [marine actinobacterium MedAcidi-G2B]|tara:strand:+ start:1230 stop:2441 length:1212 start_codon:yes stop_codon:yes gene_type:complete
MKALEFRRNVPRYAAARLAGSFTPGRGSGVGPMRLVDADLPELPNQDWEIVRPRLSGICGSDLATIDGKSARYFEPLVSFPFIPGHEVVGDLQDGTRVVLEPVLGCLSRNINPPCKSCQEGHLGNCEYVTFGEISPGIQTGSCCDTGGGWSVAFAAHKSQLHPVEKDLSDEAAVMIEPAACGVHAALSTGIEPDGTVTVIGSGTLGLVTISALRCYFPDVKILATARYPHQKSLALDLGADTVVAPNEIKRAVRRMTKSRAISLSTKDGNVDRLTGGSDAVVDCVGSSESITDALSVTRPRGKIVLVGMPSSVNLELTPLWHREIQLVGAYTYGTEKLADGNVTRTFDLAAGLVGSAKLERLLSAVYPLSRYQDALEHAASAGHRGAVKVAFDLRSEKERDLL